MSKGDIKQIVGLLKRMDDRLSALESGRRPVKVQKAPLLSPTDIVCRKVKQDLMTRQLVKLTDYCKGGVLKWARQELRKDKNLRVIKDDGETFVIKETAPKFVRLPVGGRVKYQKRATPSKLDKVMAKLDAGKTLTSVKIGRMLHITPQGANRYVDMIGRMKGYKVIRAGGSNKKFLSRVDVKLKVPKLARHEPYMRKKTGYNKFMAKRLGFYQRQGGLNGHDAFMSAVADWNRVKGVSQPSPEPFPAFQSVRTELQPILRGVLERLFRDGVAVDFKGISYSLDIQKESEYNNLITDIIRSESALRHYFGVPNGKLVWNGQTLRFER
jgi:hypothetical protein